MKRKVVTLVLILLACTVLGARRRSVGATRVCAALKPENVVVQFTGALSGCASGNTTECQMGEVITVELTSIGYDASCGEHQVEMRFGDARVDSRRATGKLPAFAHQYATSGGYMLEATVSNGRSSIKSSRMLTVATEDDDGGY